MVLIQNHRSGAIPVSRLTAPPARVCLSGLLIHLMSIGQYGDVYSAEQLEDLKVPPGNRLHPLSGNRQGQHAISINDQWRICFSFEDGDAHEVEVCD